MVRPFLNKAWHVYVYKFSAGGLYRKHSLIYKVYCFMIRDKLNCSNVSQVVNVILEFHLSHLRQHLATLRLSRSIVLTSSSYMSCCVPLFYMNGTFTTMISPIPCSRILNQYSFMYALNGKKWKVIYLKCQVYCTSKPVLNGC